jgi:hypothetical protein
MRQGEPEDRSDRSFLDGPLLDAAPIPCAQYETDRNRERAADRERRECVPQKDMQPTTRVAADVYRQDAERHCCAFSIFVLVEIVELFALGVIAHSRSLDRNADAAS